MFWAANRREEKLEIKDFDSKPFVNFLLSISENEFQLFFFFFFFFFFLPASAPSDFADTHEA